MDLKQLNYFVTIVDHRSFSKAAEKLHISQPSLSNAVKSLESELGFQILDRNTRNIELTEAGTILYKKAARLLLEMESVKKEMEDVKNIGSGEIQLGMIESVKHWIPKVILQYNDDFPNMRIKLTEVLSGNDVKNSLRNYKTHAIITNQFIQEDDIETIPLYNEKLVLVLHESNPLTNHATITFKDLVGEPFIISSEGFQTREDVLNAFEMEGVIPTIKYEIERFETALSLVREGIGISLIPENYLQALPDYALVKKCIDSPSLDRTVYLTYLKNRYVSPAIHAFINKTKLFFS
ncbi:LysR family transcriptional regulator [Psychrobacillus lasiicapitis]|uniref:LysR family transcriptional regulator n=1 Tax=Psychrobacillus lasiicapitis TaxID=1636719 RepID=A0A544T1H7_9BACI|nr:LysR family transcriptional regulator [Psychrobacillus lasiicapitis]TQR11302.1 LysR family transcriptional regulator [Psychrobacillus lasiicapitis]GGA41664.1 LysR family transcriptional regulator [Psychrobacillus lasiicapitis]